MLNELAKLVAKGLLTILPFVLTIYLLVWIALAAEGLFSPYIPSQYYFPGLGVIVVLIVLAFIGILVNAYVVKLIIERSNDLLERVPVIKTLFGAIQDAVHLFQIKKETSTKRAVSVEMADGSHAIGFVTNESVANIVFPGQNKIAVYLPLSYQIGGYTMYMDQSKVANLDIDVETAMRIAVTGGSSLDKKGEPKTKATKQSE
ncbi:MULTISPECIES: DUF502 domain-containing protein [Alteromonadaceae]|jgi:uncharacterized membrane protein|uniref:DUF502 domain-containing protein n=1 Tax=Brumicola blandensis TaxID=3075611 RepID=A0AAW8QYT2_9ALTE|nr:MULTISPECIES: DUF502 domain-containing protein [unclassified Alteromonas]MDT0582122.1 DUF502 domain-containing protein [Alteromonas sp. W409]MDT0627922.1 DUF502 domain-containing protein [Alteromonas sp. W364]